MQKNTASQYFHCICFNSDGRISGDAANITCELAIDGGTRSALGTNTATEIGTTGEYTFPLTQAETNGYELSFTPESSTGGAQVIGLPSNIIYTTEDVNVTITVPQSTIVQATVPSGTQVVYRGSEWTITLEGVDDTAYGNADYIYWGVKSADVPDSESELQIRWTKTGNVSEVLYVSGAAAGSPIDTTGCVITHTTEVIGGVTYHNFTAVIEGEATENLTTTNELNGISGLGDIPQYSTAEFGFASEWKLTGDTDLIVGRGYLVIEPGVNRVVD